MAPQNGIKKRYAITEHTRQQIRRYKRQNPLLSQAAVAKWATEKFGRKITQPTVNDSLNAKYKYLDDKPLASGVVGGSRLKPASYPLLEAALHEWQTRLNDNQVPVNGDMLCKAASELWQKIPDFAGKKEPTWSRGWLQGFKKRHRIRKYNQSGESGSADLSEETLRRIAELQDICKEFDHKDIYNADETGLFWLMTPNTTLASKPQKGRKHIKSRITLHACSNADGSDQLPLTILGNAKNPRAFGTKMRNAKDLNFRWDSNKKAWMTGKIMKDWLAALVRWKDGRTESSPHSGWVLRPPGCYGPTRRRAS